MTSVLSLLLSSAAFAATPLGPVHYIAPFTMDTPEVYTMRGDQPTYDSGYLVAFSASAEALTPQQVAHPVPYLGAWPIRLAAVDATSQCAVAIAITDRDLAEEPLFLGPATLPERVGEPEGELARTEALAQGVAPLGGAKVARLTGAPLHLSDRRALAEAAESLLTSCRTGEEPPSR